VLPTPMSELRSPHSPEAWRVTQDAKYGLENASRTRHVATTVPNSKPPGPLSSPPIVRALLLLTAV
jgi:hypothetical protein